MDFIQHTLNWTRGEILESSIFGLFGLTCLFISAAFWKFGSTPGARALIIPLLVIGLLYAAVGSFGIYNNTQRLTKFTEAHEADPEGFLQREKDRVEGFMKWYFYTFGTGTIMILGGLGIFLFVGGPRPRGIGLALILMGLSFLCIDFFSEERAVTYQQEIVKAIKQ